MSVRLVSCFYPMSSRVRPYYEMAERTARLYTEASQNYPLSLTLYCQNIDDVKCFEGLPNVDIVVTERPANPVYTRCKQDLHFPVTDNPTKDTPDFYELMMHKTWFMAETAETCSADRIAWIDYALLKHASQDEMFLSFLSTVSTYESGRICAPGYGFPYSPAQIYFAPTKELITDRPDWRLLGSYLNVPTYRMRDFAERVQDLYYRLFKRNIMTYEINVWAYLAQENLAEWVVYSADHNDRMFYEHPGFKRWCYPLSHSEISTKSGEPSCDLL